MNEENNTNQVETGVTVPHTEQTVQTNMPVEQPKSRKKTIFIIIAIIFIVAVVIILVLDNYNRKDKQYVSDYLTSPTGVVNEDERKGKKIKLIKMIEGKDWYVSDYVPNEDVEGVFEVTCFTYECKKYTHSYDGNLIVLKDGDYFTVVNNDNKLIAKDLGKDLKYPSNIWVGKTVSGDIFVSIESIDGTVIYNITSGKRSDYLKGNNIEENVYDHGLLVDLYKNTNYHILLNGGNIDVYDIQTFEKAFEIKNRELLYSFGNDTTTYINVYDQENDLRKDIDELTKDIYDVKGNKVLSDLRYVRETKESIFIEKNKQIQQLDYNLNVLKTIDNAIIVDSSEDYLLIRKNNELLLYDSNLNLLATLDGDYDKQNIRTYVYPNKCFDTENNGKICGAKVEIGLKNQADIDKFAKEYPKLKEDYDETEDKRIIHGYYYYYDNSTKTIVKIPDNILFYF